MTPFCQLLRERTFSPPALAGSASGAFSSFDQLVQLFRQSASAGVRAALRSAVELIVPTEFGEQRGKPATVLAQGRICSEKRPI
jgi:hypothetical protein